MNVGVLPEGERLPAHPLRQDGVEQMIRGDIRVTIYEFRGRWGWRAVIQKTDQEVTGLFAEGTTAKELGDALHALMSTIQAPKAGRKAALESGDDALRISALV